MRVYYDRDCDINLIKDKNVAIVGYGSQGHAHALNLHDSGAKNLCVALRPGSASAAKAEAAGIAVKSIAEAAAWADLIMMCMPDELQAETYYAHIHDNLRDGAAIAFAHGLNIHFNLIETKPTVDVIMMAGVTAGQVTIVDTGSGLVIDAQGSGQITLDGLAAGAFTTGDIVFV